MSIVLIDSSYYNFFRFYATVRWYNFCPNRRKYATNKAWVDNDIFMEMFERKWYDTLNTIIKKFGNKIVFARDGKEVWRYNIYPEYKQNRYGKNIDINDICAQYGVSNLSELLNNSSKQQLCEEFGIQFDPNVSAEDYIQTIINKQNESPGPVFKHVNEKYHTGYPVLRIPEAEGDDIIAVATKYIKTINPEIKIVIITGDRDLLQLYEKGSIDIYDLKWEPMITDNTYKHLMRKILGGDTSDNIKPIYSGCGPKTIDKILNDEKLLEQIKEKYWDNFKLNSTLIDFNQIPLKVINKIEKLLDKYVYEMCV
jgi:5'-3' exonuclease